ncbi:MAG: glycosyltransferase [Fibrobacterota bacterium]|nr:glycosyltransferase [Fibrobacterota bacterium]
MGSPTYLKWKEYEKFTVEHSDSHVSVSAPMKADADRICPAKKSELIYLNADMDKLGFDGKSRESLRKANGWENCYVLAYLGSMGFQTEWNNFHNYASYFLRLEPIIGSIRMVFIVPKVLPGFWDVLDKARISRERIKFIEGTENMRGWLSAADAGIQVMSPGPDSHTRFGVKVVEYLACGLPVIANSNAGAAADFLEESGAGVRLDLDDKFAEKATQFWRTVYSRERLMHLAADNFSLRVIGRKYGELYDELLGLAKTPP